MEPPVPNMTPPPSTDAARRYALRFISGKYQGGEFPLPEEGEITIGRSSELDMVLVEDMVSRRHSKVTVSNGEVYIQDLGSTNGTFVNGEKIDQIQLQEGDRILVGTNIIKLVPTEEAGDVQQAKANLQGMATAKRTSQVRTMTGDISEVPLPDLLQLFSASKKSGVLVVRTETDTGKIYLDKGQVVYATVNDDFELSPIKCFNRILTWNEGTFDMEPPDGREFSQPIEMSTEGLLMEAMRQMDEARRLSPEMPPMDAHVALPSSIEAPLRELSTEELDVLQLAHNHGVIGSVIDQSEASDYETSETLVKLLKSGYLHTTGE